jgi:hypothetical protein
MRAVRRHAAGLGLAVLLTASIGAACGSPVGPDGFSLDGEWSGTWTFVSAGATVTDDIDVALSQDDESVATGTWVAASGPSGQITLSPTTATNGTVTITFTTLSGQMCATTTSAMGTASGSSLELVLIDPSTSGICQWSTANRFSLVKE